MVNDVGQSFGSFRDPSGFLFSRDGSLYRQVNLSYRENYDKLMGSGLYSFLLDAGLIIPHEEADIGLAAAEGAYKVIKPKVVPFISYPYEWCFSQLKDAALATIEIIKGALRFGMTLKDASAYNIQFLGRRPVFIDTLSFEEYVEGDPWVAYRQFCQHFLAPLSLMCYKDIRLNQLLRAYIDGIPLDLAGALLPSRTRLRFDLLTHIHIHSKSQKHYADKAVNRGGRKMGRLGYLGLVDSLESSVRRMKWKPGKTEWGDYYDDTNYSREAHEKKMAIVGEFLDGLRPNAVWDLGANTGVFSRLASRKGINTVAFDIDPAAVEKNYLQADENGEDNILPILLDLTNPSPAIGWANSERKSLRERGPVDTALALALIHHLAISNNLPLDDIASFFKDICRSLVIEFVPKEDSQVRRLLASREDIFPDYREEAFEDAFARHFAIEKSIPVADSKRTIYLMRSR